MTRTGIRLNSSSTADGTLPVSPGANESKSPGSRIEFVFGIRRDRPRNFVSLVTRHAGERETHAPGWNVERDNGEGEIL